MRIVTALGGNALLRRGEPADAETQRGHVREAVAALAPLVGEHEVVVTHGNGPQVGLLALQAAAYESVAPYPLDVLGAESEGMIGYLLDQELANALGGGRVATLLTQVVVDRDDPAFAHPTKPIGPVLPGGDGRRRLVASPEPLAIVELDTIRLLCEAGVTVVCAGGGGIPVAVDAGRLVGVEAVVDKDLAAALLARELGADALLLLTDVDGVHVGDRTLRDVSPSQLRALDLDPGSMGPKAEAACRFAETGGVAAIGALRDAALLLGGAAGTRVRV